MEETDERACQSRFPPGAQSAGQARSPELLSPALELAVQPQALLRALTGEAPVVALSGGQWQERDPGEQQDSSRECS